MSPCHYFFYFNVYFFPSSNFCNNSTFSFSLVTNASYNSVSIDPKLILAAGVKSLSVSIVLGHNHPSGSLKPSRSDEELTVKITEAAKYHDVKLIDHIIVCNEGYYSFADEGLI